MIQILNKRASTHPNWCEDNYWLKTEGYTTMGAVLDGCSTGTESHFASTFFKYAIEKASQCIYFSTCPPREAFEYIAHSVLTDIDAVRKLLSLTDMNFLSTMVLFHFDDIDKRLNVMFFGDGMVFVNGERFDHAEGNAPEYLAYQLYNSVEDKQAYFESRKYMTFEDVQTFSICTDGIGSFVNLRDGKIPDEVAVQYLLNNPRFQHLKTGLSKRFTLLTSRDESIAESPELCWWEIRDDLTIIHYC